MLVVIVLLIVVVVINVTMMCCVTVPDMMKNVTTCVVCATVFTRVDQHGVREGGKGVNQNFEPRVVAQPTGWRFPSLGLCACTGASVVGAGLVDDVPVVVVADLT